MQVGRRYVLGLASSVIVLPVTEEKGEEALISLQTSSLLEMLGPPVRAGEPQGAAAIQRRGLQVPRVDVPAVTGSERRDAPPTPQKALWDHNNRPGAYLLHERVGIRSLDSPAATRGRGPCRAAVRSATADAPSPGGRWRRLPLGWGSAPDLEVLTARRTYGVCGDRCEGNWSLPSHRLPLPAREGGRRTGDESCCGPLGVPPYPIAVGVERPSRDSSLDLQLDIEATIDVACAGSTRIKLSHILC
ncbi:hypothetical protein NDU88_001350 [Pleurodeles waltl]|uniref:Uncharacterized protein n=1 Tax=Pleurodeles waltl TaxID=8319 RepID=A0AAV7UVV6_PLEWA|nr:hypothetical protein NDU88_001350 [Pleurodeles waltl]